MELADGGYCANNGTALAMTFLGEHMTLRRWLAAGVIAAGAIMLQMGS
ncbi:MAG: hypothetical protein WDM81_01640 [Rhizomicrobium sp.]